MKVSKKKLEPMKETQMVSLADMAFLIIFFFMLSSQFMKDRTTIVLPTIPRSTDTHSQITISLDSALKIRLNGDEVSDQTALESKLRDLLAGKTKSDECEVRFLCDKNLKYKSYRPIYEAISSAGGVISVMQEVRR